MYGFSHTLATSLGMSPPTHAQKRSLFLLKTEFLSNFCQFHDTRCLIIDFAFIGPFCDSIPNSVIRKTTGFQLRASQRLHTFETQSSRPKKTQQKTAHRSSPLSAGCHMLLFHTHNEEPLKGKKMLKKALCGHEVLIYQNRQTQMPPARRQFKGQDRRYHDGCYLARRCPDWVRPGRVSWKGQRVIHSRGRADTVTMDQRGAGGGEWGRGIAVNQKQRNKKQSEMIKTGGEGTAGHLVL